MSVRERVIRYRAEWRSMNRVERDTLTCLLPLPLVYVAILVLGISLRNWLTAAAGFMGLPLAVESILQLCVAASWRNLYERERDRPRPETWQCN